MVESLWESVFKLKREEESVRDFLKSTFIFSELTSGEIRRLEKIVHRRRYRAGEIIFNQGDPGAGMYVIMRGKVRIFLQDENGRETVIASLSKGDFFGETAVIDRRPRSAGAKAVEDTELIGFFRPDLIDIMERFPKMGAKILFKIAEVFAERLRKTNEELIKERKKAKETDAGT